MHQLRITIFLFGLVIYGQTFGQSKLPPCQGIEVSGWSNCSGSANWPDIGLSYGDQYSGGFKDSKFHGQGTINYSNGDMYIGQWKDGNYDGIGSYVFFDGSKQIGQFKNNKLNGKATKLDETGKVFEQGVYEDDVLIKPMNINSSNFNDSGKDKKQKCLKLGLVDGNPP